MPLQFAEDGVRFVYPETWEMTRESNPTGWTVTLQSPATAFVLITLDRDMPESELMAETALEAMQGEYADLESETVTESIAGQPAIGYNMRFFSFDLTNTCGVRGLYAEAGTVLVFWQTNDLELDNVETMVHALLASMKLDED